MNPQHSVRLQQPSDGERTHVRRLKPQLVRQPRHVRLGGGVVTADQHRRRPRAKPGVHHHGPADAVESLDHSRAAGPRRHLLRPGCLVPDQQPSFKRSGPRRMGLVASISTLPLNAPAERSASWVLAHGVERRTTAASAAASATEATRAFDPAAFRSSWPFGARMSRTPKVTRCPPCAHRVPSVPPTFPAPMIAMSITFSFANERLLRPNAPGIELPAARECTKERPTAAAEPIRVI